MGPNQTSLQSPPHHLPDIFDDGEALPIMQDVEPDTDLPPPPSPTLDNSSAQTSGFGIHSLFNSIALRLSPQRKRVRGDSESSLAPTQLHDSNAMDTSDMPAPTSVLPPPSRLQGIILRLSPKKKRQRHDRNVLGEADSVVNSILDSRHDRERLEPAEPVKEEYFDEEDEDAEEDARPLSKIADPSGEDAEPDDSEAQFKAFMALVKKGRFIWPPTVDECKRAAAYIKTLLDPPRKGSRGHKRCELDVLTQRRLIEIQGLLNEYIHLKKLHAGKSGNWGAAAATAARATNTGKAHAATLKRWTRSFIADTNELPHYKHGGGVRGVLDDEEVSLEIKLRLEEIGKYICAEDIVIFCGTPDMLKLLGRTKTISVSTARRWLIKTGFRWLRNPTGQYIDGHERQDVVQYRDTVYVPEMMKLAERMHRWIKGIGWALPCSVHRAVTVWFHDESTFYAHDRRKSYWVLPGASCAPEPKGECQDRLGSGRSRSQRIRQREEVR